MTIHAMDLRTCPTHGEQTLHHLGACCRCFPLPEPRVKAKPPKPTPAKRGRPLTVGLTEKEAQIAAHLASGMTQKQIAQQYGVTRDAVMSAINRGMARLNLTQTYELVRYVRQQRGAAV